MSDPFHSTLGASEPRILRSSERRRGVSHEELENAVDQSGLRCTNPDEVAKALILSPKKENSNELLLSPNSLLKQAAAKRDQSGMDGSFKSSLIAAGNEHRAAADESTAAAEV